MAKPPSAHGGSARATSVQLADELQQENVGDTSNMLESEEPSEQLGPAPSRCAWQMCGSLFMRQHHGEANSWALSDQAFTQSVQLMLCPCAAVQRPLTG